MAKIKTGKNSSKKEAIVKKAAQLFRTKSYSAASMRELADSIGVEAPSLYNHIGSKSELLQVICFHVANSFTDHLETVENAEGKVVQKIEAVIRFHIQMMLEYFDEVFVANHEWKHLQEPFMTNFLTQRRNYEKRLMALIESGILKKELRKTNPYTTVLVILSAVRGLEFWHRHKKNVPAISITEDMVQHLLNGIIK